MIIKKCIYPQTCDMGSSYSVYDMTEPMTLEQALDWIENNISAWGVITIKFRNGEVLRKFDYDLYISKNRKFYHHLSWERKEIVEMLESHSCYMACDFEIQLK